MAESKFVKVVSKTTKEIQSIPRKWLGHPKLGADFELPPSTKAAQAASDQAQNAAKAPAGDARHGATAPSATTESTSSVEKE